MSDVPRKFRTQPPTSPDEQFSFVVYGDMGVSAVPGAHDTASYMIEEAMNGKSFVFHVGDISYARGYVSKTETETISSKNPAVLHKEQRPIALKELKWFSC